MIYKTYEGDNIEINEHDLYVIEQEASRQRLPTSSESYYHGSMEGMLRDFIANGDGKSVEEFFDIE